MENIVGEMQSGLPTMPAQNDDQPLDLSLKQEKKIIVTPEQLKRLSAVPDFNNACKNVDSLIFIPAILESWTQPYDAYNLASQSPATSANSVDENSTEICDTPKANKTKRPNSSMESTMKIHKRMKMEEGPADINCPVLLDNDGVSERVAIGVNGTSISRKDWNSINWRLTPSAITRKLLMAVFGRHTVAHNTLSGKQSPAFLDCQKPEKGQLNPKMVQDIITFMKTHFQINDNYVKGAITSKCSDVSKAYRKRPSLEDKK